MATPQDSPSAHRPSYSLTSYQEFVLSKAAPPYATDPFSFQLLHAALGLSTELLELLIAAEKDDDENLIEELGDFYWYLSLASYHLGIFVIDPPPSSSNPPHLAKDIVVSTEAFVSLVKKQVIYQVPQTLQDPLLKIWEAFYNVLDDCNITLFKLEERNRNKLNKRYASTFTPEESEVRKDKETKE